MSKTTLTIDGKNFSDFKGFVREFNFNVFGDDRTWQGGLDQLNDELRGGFGAPEEPFTIRWLNAKKSRVDLGYDAMLQWLMNGRKTVHPTAADLWDKRIEITKQKRGETLFLLLVDVIVSHKHITLILE